MRTRTRVELLDVVVDIGILNVGSQRVCTNEFGYLRHNVIDDICYLRWRMLDETCWAESHMYV